MPATDAESDPMSRPHARSPWGALLRLTRRWRRAWRSSLSFRLTALGLVPLLVAFPLVLAALLVFGGQRADALLESNLRSNLAGARNYLDQIRGDTGLRVAQLSRSPRLVALVGSRTTGRDLDDELRSAAETSGLDYLVVALADGRVIGSSAGPVSGGQLPDTFVLRQARIGVANAALEVYDLAALAALGPHLPSQARIEPPPGAGGRDGAGETRGLLINAGAHFPLAVSSTDAVLIGGTLVNRNAALIEHMRELIYPVGSLPDDAEGVASLYLHAGSVAASRQRLIGARPSGELLSGDIAARVLDEGVPWIGRQSLAGVSHLTGYAPVTDGDGRRVGMIGVGVPDAPYNRVLAVVLGVVGGLLALTMLVISALFLRTGRELTQRLVDMARTMDVVREGDRSARVGDLHRQDELGRLARHFDGLLGTIEAQDARQREVQQSLADEASRRRALFEHERDGVVILDENGRVLEANPKFAAMVGYAPDELKGTHFMRWEARHTIEQLRQMRRDVGPEGLFFETEHRRRDGSLYTAEVSMSVAHWGGRDFVFLLFRDITERKQVEAELDHYRRSLEQQVAERTRDLESRNAQLDAIFALSPDGLVSFDAQGRVASVNAAFARMTGLDERQLPGTDEARLQQQLESISRASAPFPGFDRLREGRDPDTSGPRANRRHRFELSGAGQRVLEAELREAAGAAVSQILYVRDVTHESEVDRMKSEFLTTAAHELRTPMTSIYGYAELLRAREFPAPRRQEMVETIVRQSTWMLSILNELLDLGRIEARRGADFVFERVSVEDLVHEAITAIQRPEGRDAPVCPPWPPAWPGPFVQADRQKLRQALLNILSNAYKYSAEGGEVQVQWRHEVRESGPRLGVAVRDQGIGMSESQCARIFERFYRADPSGNILGTGLGMSIVREIVELHRGEVEVESRLGDGTTVTVWLPHAA
jgi:PAS domain S-box-containing protein